MKRVPEPELMDEDEQARAYSEADFDKPHDACADTFAGWFQAQGLPANARILDVGCGPADLTVRIAERLPHVRLVGLDGSEAMLRYGHQRVAALGLQNRITLHRAFLPQDAPPPGEVAAVFSNSLLHHLHDPMVLWRYLQSHAPKARVFVMDLMRPDTLQQVDALVQEHAAGEPDVLRRDFHASLGAAFTVDEVKQQTRAVGLDLDVRATSDRHLLAAHR